MKKIIIILAAILYLSVIFLPNSTILTFTSDDGFYYFEMAKNTLENHIVTFDGSSITNGIQPLYFLIILLPFLKIIPNNPFLVTKLILLTLLLLHLIAGHFIYETTKKVSNKTAATYATIFWLFSPVILKSILSGVEASLNTLLIAIMIFFYISIREKINLKNIILLGIISGLTFLGRADAVFLCAIIFFDIVYKKREIKTPLIYFLSTVVVVSPWFVWSYLTSETLMQISGKAMSYHRHLLHPITLKFVGEKIVSMSYIILTTTGAASLFTFLIGSTFSRKNNTKLIPYTIPFIILPFFFTSYILVLICSIITFFIGTQVGHKKIRNKFIFIFIALIFILIPYYIFYSMGAQIWYYSSIFVFTSIFAGILLSKIPSKIPKIVSYLLIILLLCNFLIAFYPGDMIANSEKYEMITFLEQNTEEDAKIGSFNSGLYGFFTDRTIVNLDGVVNNNVYHAMINHELKEYIEENTDYLIDYDTSFEEFSIHSDEPLLENFSIIYEEESEVYPGRKMQVYKKIA